MSNDQGADLLEKIATLSGLPDEVAKDELNKIVEWAGHSSEKVTLEELRGAMINYLESLSQDFLEDDSNVINKQLN